MKTFFTLLLIICCAFNTIFAQKEIKQIIYDDLLALNDLQNGCLIQYEQPHLIIKGNDTIRQLNTIINLRDSSDSRVRILSIDTVYFNFYIVKVKFALLSTYPCFSLFDNTFEYVLYKDNDKYYKINGFIESEIIGHSWIFTNNIRDLLQIRMSYNKFRQCLHKRNVAEIQKYLHVSVLKVLVDKGYYIYDKPYVKDPICGYN